MIRRVVFRPAAVRDFARLDRIVQARIDAALVRYATTGHGDVKSLKDRPGELRLRVDSGASFSPSNRLISSASSALTTVAKPINPQSTPRDLTGSLFSNHARGGRAKSSHSLKRHTPVNRRPRR